LITYKIKDNQLKLVVVKPNGMKKSRWLRIVVRVTKALSPLGIRVRRTNV